MSHTHEKQSVALSSVFASALLTAGKLFVGLLTGSIGILSEAIHSLLDLFAAALTYFSVRVSDRPPDLDHPFGHGKVENLSAFVETLLLLATSGWIIVEAVERLVGKHFSVQATWYAFATIIISILVDFSRSRALMRVAKKTHSQALEADALHFRSDILSSLVVLLGLALSCFGYHKADALAAVGVSLFVLHAAFKLGRNSVRVLIDTAPAGVAADIEKQVRRVAGIAGVDYVRTRSVGPILYIDIHAAVGRAMALESAESLCREIEQAVRGAYPDSEVTAHVRPMPLDDETIAERVRIAAAHGSSPVHDITVFTRENRRHVSFDLEVDGTTPLQRAHETASALEHRVREELGGEVEVISHIDPAAPEPIRQERLDAAEEQKIRDEVERLAESQNLVHGVHNLRVFRMGRGFYLSLHCRFAPDTPLSLAHDAATRFEILLRESIPGTQKVVVHTEPGKAGA